MNDLTDKIWSVIEARLVDIKHALADQTEEMHRYVFAVPKTRIESLRGRFPKFTPENLFEQALNGDKEEIGDYVLNVIKRLYKIKFGGPRGRLPTQRHE